MHIRKGGISNKSADIIRHIIHIKISARSADAKGLHTCWQGALAIWLAPNTSLGKQSSIILAEASVNLKISLFDPFAISSL